MAHDDQNFPLESGVSAFGSLALQVVSVLNARHAGKHANEARPQIRALLDRRLTTKAFFNASDALDELRTLKLSDEAIIDKYIPDAARSVGAKWVDDMLGFAEVTIASVRLHSLLTEVEFIRPDRSPPYDCTMQVLVVTCEGEQHTLGSFVVAAQMRRHGAMVDVLCGEPDTVVRNRIASGQYDAVLFSCSRKQDLECIAEIIRYTRQTRSAVPIFALGGIVAQRNRGIVRRTGVDIATNDVERVVEYCREKSALSLKSLKQASR